MNNQFDGLRFQVTLKIWRNMHDFTQKDVAASAGIATSSYAFIETGDRTPTMAEFSHLCGLMGFDAKDFFKASETLKNG